jgi:hypothetical protein
MVFGWWLQLAAAAAPDPEAAVVQATEQFQQGDLDAAIATLEDAVQSWPTAPEPRLALATWLLASGRLDRLGVVLAEAPADQREALTPHRMVGALLASSVEGVGPDNPLRAVSIEAECEALRARGGEQAVFADTLALVQAVMRRSEAGVDPAADEAVAERATALLVRAEPSVAAMQAGAAALTLVDGWALAIDGVKRAMASGADRSAGTLLLARMHLLWGLRDEKAGHLATAEKLLRKVDAVDGVSAAALGAERFAVTLARTDLPRGPDGRATEARVREVLGALDATLEGDQRWIEALSLTLATVATANGDGSSAVAAVQAVDLDTADPIAAMVVALAMARRGSLALVDVLPGLADGGDRTTRAVAGAWLDAAPGAEAGAWLPVAAGAANVGLEMSDAGPRLQVSMRPTVVMVLVP